MTDGSLEVGSPERVVQLGKLDVRERHLAQKERELESVCFPGDTPVVCGNGSFANIAFMEPGAVVMSRCEKTGELAPKRVVKVYESSAKYYAISLNYGPAHFKQYGSDSNPYLYATGGHPFWVEGKGWTPVKELTAGDVVFALNGDPTTIDYVLAPEEFAKRKNPSFAAHAAPVYNLEVEDFNTYFVGAGRIWVHNCNNTKPNMQVLNPRLDSRPQWSSLQRRPPSAHL